MSQQSATPQSKPKRERVLTRRQQQRRDQKKADVNSDDENLNELCYIGPRDDGTSDPSNTAALPPIPRQKFKYGDHTADIILHGYGWTPQEAIETTTYAMLAYMFDHPERTPVNPVLNHTITIFGQDIPDLIFRFLTEILAQGVNYWDDLTSDVKARIGSEPSYPGMIPRVVTVVSLTEEKPVGSSAGMGSSGGFAGKGRAAGMVSSSTTNTATSNPTSNSTSTAGTIQDLDNNNNYNVQAVADDDATRSFDVNNLNNTKGAGKIFKLVVEIQGDWLNVVRLGAGTEVKAITKELTMLQLLTDAEEIQKHGGKYHLQVLVDI